MDSLCQACSGMLGLGDAKNHRKWKNKVDINFQRWSENALAGSCHLCTMLFYAAAGPHHQKFIEAHTAATYELSGSGLGRKVRDFIDTNEGNFKYLALVETLRFDSHKSKWIFPGEESPVNNYVDMIMNRR